jgi:hypothetical protein
MEKHFVYCKIQTEFLVLLGNSDETFPFSASPCLILYDLHLVIRSSIVCTFLSTSNNLPALSINSICQTTEIMPSASEIYNTANNSDFCEYKSIVNVRLGLHAYEKVFSKLLRTGEHVQDQRLKSFAPCLKFVVVKVTPDV